jgi:hypothetical protein
MISNMDMNQTLNADSSSWYNLIITKSKRLDVEWKFDRCPRETFDTESAWHFPVGRSSAVVSRSSAVVGRLLATTKCQKRKIPPARLHRFISQLPPKHTPAQQSCLWLSSIHFFVVRCKDVTSVSSCRIFI